MELRCERRGVRSGRSADHQGLGRYFRTDFLRQAVVDYDSRPGVLLIADLKGKSYSNVMQVEVTWESSFGVTATAAYRLNDVKTTYGGKLMEKALTSRYKALLTVGYKTPLELWQFDATFVMNGGGRIAGAIHDLRRFDELGRAFSGIPFAQFSGHAIFPPFLRLYRRGEPDEFPSEESDCRCLAAMGPTFDPTVVWGPISGAMVYSRHTRELVINT